MAAPSQVVSRTVYWRYSEKFCDTFLCQLLCDRNMPWDVDRMDFWLFVVDLLWPNISQSKAIYNACLNWTLCFPCSKHFIRSKLMHIPMHVSSLVNTESINYIRWLGMKCIGYVSYNSAEQTVRLKPKSPGQIWQVWLGKHLPTYWNKASNQLKATRATSITGISFQYQTLIISSNHFIFETHLIWKWYWFYIFWLGQVIDPVCSEGYHLAEYQCLSIVQVHEMPLMTILWYTWQDLQLPAKN